MEVNIREPKQQRAKIKKEKIISSGFDLICKYGYYNINTAQIAEYANVSTGIVYQYFKDKHDILMEGLTKYGDNIFYPMIKVPNIKVNKDNFSNIIKNMINEYINNHKISKTAHEELMSMVHSDKEVADYYYKREVEVTKTIMDYLIDSGFMDNDLLEKVHIMIGLIDNLCHEIIYHKHTIMNYDIMSEIVINIIKEIFKNDLSN